jgi:hypothetical protein
MDLKGVIASQNLLISEAKGKSYVKFRVDFPQSQGIALRARQEAKGKSANLRLGGFRREQSLQERQKGGICESLIRLFTILRFCAYDRPARTAVVLLKPYLPSLHNNQR